MAKLIIHRKDGTEVAFPLVQPEVLIGRMDSTDLILDESTVSRVHAKIVRDNDGDVLIDLESTTGTTVNGSPVLKHRLAHGDMIEIASTRMEYRE